MSRPLLTPPGDTWAILPAHEDDGTGTCLHCHEALNTETYEEYVTWWYANEYEGTIIAEDGGIIDYGPSEREVWQYLKDSCMAVCQAHYPLLLDGKEVLCDLPAGHAGDHKETHIDGETYTFADQPECWE